jgi:hypothetical protein
MRTTLIRYRTLHDKADDNQRAVASVFAELAQTLPLGLQYLAMRGPDATFYHLVMAEPDAPALIDLDSFRAFREGLRDRLREAPVTVELTVIGNHRRVPL